MPTPLAPSRKVLISGASIAGPTLAYWLHRYGFDVTIVERADAVRSGGYPIDVRGTAIDVVERMGLLPRLREAHINARRLTFVDENAATIAIIPPEAVTGGVAGRDIEVPRGVLTFLLFALTQNGAIRYRFNDSIDTLEDDGEGVTVRFKSGDAQRYDIVIGADGLHSRTRALVFGPEEQFNRYLGWCFNLFSLPNMAGLSHEGVTYAAPGRMAGMYAVGDNAMLHAFLTFATDEPPVHSRTDAGAQCRRTAEVFARDGWEVPHLVEAMQTSDDLYFDTVSQIRMPRWSSGRVVLVGDAAYAPSFLSGQGTSLALVGAYILAGELASHDNPQDAFAAYERIVRPFVEANQALATIGESLLLPRTQEELDRRNQLLAGGLSSADDSEQAARRREVHNMLKLPDYGRAAG